ncbi:MAG: MmgE/PrpD family protein [Pseudomonadota bacterium]
MLSKFSLDRLRFAAHWRLQKLSNLLAPSIPAPDTVHGGVPPDPAEVFASMTEHMENARSNALSTEVLFQARLSIIDTLACVFAGIASKEGQSILALHNISKVHFLDQGRVASARDHAGLIAALAQIHDFNDGFQGAEQRGGAFHPGRVIVPTALAAGIHHSVRGKDLLTAIALGYDLACHTSHTPMSTPADSYGAAGCSAWLARLAPAQIAFAIRVAALMSPRSGSEDFETNNLTVAQQAASCVLATELVEAGYPISRARSESLQAPKFNFSRPSYPGESFNELYRKPYPCCRDIHRAIDAALQLRASAQDLFSSIVTEAVHDHAASQIDSIDVEVPSSLAGPVYALPAGEYYKSYQFSIPYVIAVALVDGAVGLEQFTESRSGDPNVHYLQSKVRLQQEEPTGRAAKFARITVRLSTGETLESECTDATGSPDKPLTEEDLFEKLHENAESAGLNVTTLAQNLRTLAAAEDVADKLTL